MTRQVSPLALGLLALMALALAVPWLAPGAPARWRQWQPPAPQAPNLDDVKAAALQFNAAAGAAYPVVLARPLMDPSRRPQAPAGAASAPAAPPPTAIEQVTLQGIVAGPTLTGVFLEEAGRSRFVLRGEKVGDWTLDAIEGRDIVFRRGGEQRRIELLPAKADQDQAKEKDKAREPASGRRAPGGAPGAPPARPPAREPAPQPPATSAPAPAPAPAPTPAREGQSMDGSFGGGPPQPPAGRTSR
ncbi:MAG: hypothetical protein QM772_08000 [Ottowia sp.]|uniref:hypothetical protein n=1 Tax=Ottowia sp. TaxID=1898956 RepID=UPI0039E5C963